MNPNAYNQQCERQLHKVEEAVGFGVGENRIKLWMAVAECVQGQPKIQQG